MGFPGGFMGQMLRIDLSEKTIQIEPLPEFLVEKYMGGAGVNAALAYDLLIPGDDPLSPRNYLIFGAGPMIGTMVPGAAKCNLTGRSMESKFLGTSNHGKFGMLKYAGFDHLIITGKSEKPVYLKIENEKVSFCPAEHLWGRDLFEATDAIWNETSDDFDVTCIGPAGENMTHDASVVTNKCASMSRTGMGAVMGSKNLKGIAIYGTRSVGVADKAKFLKLHKELYRGIRLHPNLLAWRKYGTMISVEIFSKLGLYGAENYQAAFDDKFFEIFNPNRFVSEIKEGDWACNACPIGCKHFIRIKEGEFAGTTISVGCMNAVIQTYGGQCMLNSLEEVIKTAETAARMGIDWMSSAQLIALVMELYQRGILSKDQLDGLEPKWGDGNVARELVRKIAFREGIGDILAEGLVKATERLPPGSDRYSMHTKGLGMIYDPRVNLMSTEIFSQITNIRGHASNVSVAMVPRTPDQIRRYCKNLGLPDDAIDRIVDEKGYNVARLTKWVEDVTSVMHIMGVCYFPLYQRLPFALWAELYTAVTGREMTPHGLIEISENYWDVQKAYNLREGATRGDDTLPERFFTDAVPLADKEVIPPRDRAYVDRLVSDYYEERGWDRTTGAPLKEKLAKLGIR